MRPLYTIIIFFIVYSPFVFGLNESNVIDQNIPFDSQIYSHNCDNTNQLINFVSDCFVEKQETSSWYSFHTPMEKKKIEFSFFNESLGENASIAIFDDSKHMQIWQKCLSSGTEKTEATFVNLETDYTYNIQVSSTFESQGDFNFKVAFATGNPPANDNCDGAQEMFGDGILECYESEQVFGDFTCATADPEATGDCVDPTELGVWYTFSTPDPLPYNTMWQALGPSMPFEIFSTTSDCSGLEYVTCSESTLMFYPEPGTTYYILSIGNSLSWSLHDPPFPINCDDPLSHLNNGPGENQANANTQCADPSTLFPCEDDHTVWFEYTTGCNIGDITIEVEEYTSALGDGPAAEIAIVAVFDDCATLLSSYDPNGNGYVCSAMSAGEILTLLGLPANSNLVFGFGSDGNNTGNLTITVNEVNSGFSPNDECIDAINLNQGLNPELSNYCATIDEIIPSCEPQSEATVWYEFDAGSDPVDITLDLSLINIVDPAIGVYGACSGDFLGSVCGTMLELECLSGIIKIQIGSENSNEGEFELDISVESSLIPPPPEYTASNICSGNLTDITIFFPGGEIGDFGISVSSTSSSNIQGMQNHSFSDESSITINDLLTNTSNGIETAIYNIETSLDGYSCPSETLELLFMVYPQFIADPPDLEACLPAMINLLGTDIIEGGVSPYQSFSWLWNGVEDIGSSNNLMVELTEGGTITLVIVDDVACTVTTDINITSIISEEPNFYFETIYCPADDDIITFPEFSDEGIEGTWNPATIDVDEFSGLDLLISFTPSDEYCAETITLEIEIEQEDFPEFSLPDSLCTNLGIYFFPLEDLNGIIGEWEIESIDLSSTLGQVNNVFHPFGSDCVHSYEHSFEVVNSIEITFDTPSVICLMDTNIILNPESLEGYSGEWLIPVFNPSLIAVNTFENTWIADESRQEFCVTDEVITIEISEPEQAQFDLPAFMCNTDTVYYFPTITNDSSFVGNWSIDSIDPGIALDSILSVFTADTEFCADSFEWTVTIMQSDDPEFSFEDILCALDPEFTLPTVSDNGISGTWNLPIVNPGMLSGQTVNISFQPDSVFACANIIQDQLSIESPKNAAFNLPEEICWDDNNYLLPTISNENIQGSWSIPEIIIQDNIGQIVSATFTPLDDQCALDYNYEVLIISPYDIQIQENVPADCVSANGDIQILGNTADLEFSIDGGLSWQLENLFDELGSGAYEILIRSTVYVSCVLSLEANLNIVDAPQLENIIETAVSGCTINDGEITIEATGNNLEYSLDGLLWQSENCFKDLMVGFYQIFIRDVNALDCIVEGNTTIEAYPEAIILSINTMDISDCQAADGQIQIMAEGINLEYSIDGGATWSSQNSFTNLPFGDYSVAVRSSDAHDCEDIEDVIVSAPEMPEITDIQSEIPNNCELDIGEIEIIANGIDIEYSIDGGQTWQDEFIFQNLSAGIYNILIREKNNTNCIDTETVELINEIQMLAEIVIETNPVSDCMAQDGVITVDIDEIGVEYSIDGGNSWQDEAVFTGLSPGTYNVIVRKVGNDGCASIIDAIIENEDRPCEDLDVVFDIVIPDCTSSETASASIVSIEGMTDPNIELMWNNGETTETVLDLINGMYSLTIQYDNNCVWTETFDIELTELLSYDWLNQNADCPSAENGALEIINVSGGNGPYTYSIDGLPFQTEVIFINLSDGTYDIAVKDSDGCILIQTVQVLSDENLQLDLPDLITIELDESVTLEPSIQESSIDSFTWLVNNIELVGAEFTLIHFPTESSTFSLIVYYGTCSEVVSTFVEVTKNIKPIEEEESSIYLGNIFNPSSQGTNNRFFVQPKPGIDIQVSNFRIFDRWGNLVFDKTNPELNNPDDGWDGTFNNYEVDSGVFVYVILYTLDGQEEVLAGNVTLLR